VRKVHVRDEIISSKLFIGTPGAIGEGNWSNVKTGTYKPNMSFSHIVTLGYK